MYRLVISTQYGLTRKHYYLDYETLEYDATFCRFSPNISTAVAEKLTLTGWKRLFIIETQKTI